MSKLKQLEKQFPFLKKHKTGSEGLSLEGFPVEQLDLISILKASQEISENILPEKLNEALIRIVIRQAGAEKGYLLFDYDGRLSVVSEAVSNKEIVVKVHDTPLEPDYKMLPEKIFQFVKRTGSTIIIDEASQDKVFGSDKYIEVSRPRSIACLPIIKQGKHLGIIYLENNLVPGAFSADKIAVLKILTLQAAISIENAFYYREINKLNETLEHRVKERTEALKKTQATLQLSEEKYRKIVEETGDAVYSSDYKGHLTYVNPVCKKLTGYTENELVGKHFLEIIAPDWKDKVAKYYKEQFDNKVQETSFSFPIITKSGEKKWVEQTVTQLKEGDLITGHNAIVRDITERKRTEDELKNSNDRFLKIFENNPIGMTLSNIETRDFANVNAVFCEYYGYTKEEAIGKKGEDLKLLTPESQEKIGSILKKDGKVNNIEVLARKKNGETFWVLVSVEMIIINGKTLGLSSFININERKKAEEIIKQKSEELANTNKELEQFVYVASHDLQEPLRTISNFVGLLEKKYSGITDTATVQYLQFIVDAATRMQNLIKDLLDLSRIGRNVIYTKVDCNEVFKEVIANMEASIKESNAKITSAKLPVLKGNAIELKQLFQNLISNAIKFRKKNGIPEINITVEDKNTEYLFTIKDNGIGIEELSIKKLFVIFQRLNAATEYPGTGIGLATCKKIIDLHHGKIWVESKFGMGSTFYFSLPKEI